MSFVPTLKSYLKINVGGALGALIIKALHMTLRWEWYGLDNLEFKEGQSDSPRIWAVWHARQIINFGIYFSFRSRYPKNYIFGLVSAHEDGRIIANAMNWLGMRSVKGSSTRGGHEAMIAMVRRARQGKQLVITPDGPTGPPCLAKAGVIRLAQLSGRPITPVGLAVKHCWRIKSWDRLIIPKPFSRGVGYIGKPIYIPAELLGEDFDNWKLTLTETMNELVQCADNYQYK
jgi:lysophospholipid acyltransferase (LPLAT)-like uncharacterized protein